MGHPGGQVAVHDQHRLQALDVLGVGETADVEQTNRWSNEPWHEASERHQPRPNLLHFRERKIRFKEDREAVHAALVHPVYRQPFARKGMGP